jgi:protein TonB
MKSVFCLFLFTTVFFCAQAQKGETLYAYKKDWSPTSSLDSAFFVMSVVKESDTLYTCRNYQIYGPMISWESYKDAALEIANGDFIWYNIKGEKDSSATFLNGQKISFDNNIKAVVQNSNNSINKQAIEGDSTKQKLIDVNIDPADSHPAEFNGGIKGWTYYLEKNLVTPDRLKNLTNKSTKYTVVVCFIVDKSGNLSNIRIEKSCEWSADNEIIRILKKSPKWLPATIKGSSVVYRHIQSITFLVDVY